MEKSEQKARIAVFVDGANLFYMQKDTLNTFVDLERLLDFIRKFGNIADAYYYIGHDSQNEENKQQGFIDKLPHLGFSVVTKPLKTFHDSSGRTNKQKANLDVEIVLDMFNTIDNYDIAFLISGDGDFVRPMELLRAKGKRFKILATEGHIAQDLLKLAGMHYIDFKDILDKLKKD